MLLVTMTVTKSSHFDTILPFRNPINVAVVSIVSLHMCQCRMTILLAH